MAACAGNVTEKTPRIRIAGSDTMLPLNQAWAEAFRQEHPEVVFDIRGGGSSIGIDALIAGKIDIATASRTISPEEVSRIASHYRKIGLSLRVAKDHFSVFVHPNNPIRGLSLETLSQIFDGTLTNWRDVGGADRPIHLLRRPDTAGSTTFFRNRVLEGKAFGENANTVETTEELVHEIAMDPDAIGYGGTAYGDTTLVIHLRVEGHSPLEISPQSEQYPLSRYLYFLTITPPEGILKAYIDWVTGPDGQAIVSSVGYFPLW